MFNSQRPHIDDLPTSRELWRATAIAAGVAGLLLVTVVLPAEHGIDPTGIGSVLGLTQMGEIKQQLAAEAALDAAMDAGAAAAAANARAVPPAEMRAEMPALSPSETGSTGPGSPTPEGPTPGAVPAVVAAAAGAATPAAAAARTDVTTIALAPGEAAEIKLTAAKGAEIRFSWSVDRGHVNYDTHADAPGISYHGYGKGKESKGESGKLVAAFDGKHGWYWRNRSDVPLTVTLKTEGAYTEVRRMM
ncbi:MAG: transmembrane anchor protein [Sphingomonas sp.]|nr:MAG: transmembrane anchor protein [Sphingomonas sp.]